MSDPIDLPRRDFPDARPPHLPDVLTGTSLWVWLFVLAALVQVALAWGTGLSTDPLAGPAENIANVAGRIGPIASSLFGAALFIRHPDARQTLPLLVFGVGLFAASALLGSIDTALGRFLDGLFPANGVDSPVSPALVALSVFGSLISTFAVLYTGAGLTAARRSGATSAFRPLVVWLSVLAILNVLVSAASTVSLDAGTSTWFLVLGLVGVVLNLISALAWTYLLAGAIDGWLADERPRVAWGIAAVGAALHLVVALVVGLSAVLGSLDVAGAEVVFVVVTVGSALAWLLLLVAFAVGLPSTGAPSATPDPPAAPTPGSAAG
ncbi:MAG: hypothetical protein M3P84_08465 [Chloroflexota bacterium]|nr:hypothetical protein [Chloroflexota bacterium]